MASRIIELAAAAERWVLAPSALCAAQPLLSLKRGHEDDLSDSALSDELAGITEGGEEVALVGDHQDTLLLCSFPDDDLGVRDGADHGLLSEHVEAAVEAGHDLLEVECVGGGDDHAVERHLSQHLMVVGEGRQPGQMRVALQHTLEAGFAGVREGGNLRRLDLLELVHVPVHDSAAADQPEVDFLWHLPTSPALGVQDTRHAWRSFQAVPSDSPFVGKNLHFGRWALFSRRRLPGLGE